jgi:transcriptional regulator with XRE-family HTH domain
VQSCVYIFRQLGLLAKKMTAFELIQRAAAVLYGDRQAAMAHDLGVTTRTVYRWLHGQATPALKIFVTLLERLHTRLDELDSLGATIKEYLESNDPPNSSRHKAQCAQRTLGSRWMASATRSIIPSYFSRVSPSTGPSCTP